MKHIFYVHSFTTYIVSMSVVFEEHIPQQDVLFLYGRKFSYTEPSNIKVVLLSDEQAFLSKIPTYGERFLIKRLRTISQVDKLIDQFVQNDFFIAYLPSTRNFLMQLIFTHSLCKSLAIIEEGLMTYTGEFYRKTELTYSGTWIGFIKRWIKFPKHLNRSFYYRPYDFDRPIPVYVFVDGFRISHNFDVRVLSRVISPEVDSEYKLENAHILFMQPIVELGAASLQSMLAVIGLLVDYLLRMNVKVLWIKFHPEQRIEQAVINHLGGFNISCRIIPNDVSAEAILLNSRDIYIYGINSSLLFYAACWGHHAFSLSKLLEQIDPLFGENYKNWHNPDIFFQKVPLLKVI